MHTWPTTTAILVIDPYNDFVSDGGKFWPLTGETVAGVHLLENLAQLLHHARDAGLPVVVVPHLRYAPGQHDGWLRLNPMQQQSSEAQAFEMGTWGGEFREDIGPQPGDLVVGEHWGQNGFVGSDLEVQLNMRGITHVIVTGLIANTCVDATARYAGELGFHVTLVQDAIGAWSWEGMNATFEVNAPAYAHAILTTATLLEGLPQRRSE